MTREHTRIDGTLFAFWHYDSFPFVLGGTVMRMAGDGSVEIKEYGTGGWFKPFKILPFEEGKALQAKLKALEAEFNDAIDDVRFTFEDKLDAVLKIPDRMTWSHDRRKKWEAKQKKAVFAPLGHGEG